MGLERTQEKPTKRTAEARRDSGAGTAARGLHAPEDARDGGGAWRRVAAPLLTRVGRLARASQGEPNPGFAGEMAAGKWRRRRRATADDTCSDANLK